MNDPNTRKLNQDDSPQMAMNQPTKVVPPELELARQNLSAAVTQAADRIVQLKDMVSTRMTDVDVKNFGDQLDGMAQLLRSVVEPPVPVPTPPTLNTNRR